MFDRNIGQTKYSLWSGKLIYSVTNKVNTYVNFQNITNTKFAEISTVPLPPRWTMVGISIKI
jgi:hypothetical protein